MVYLPVELQLKIADNICNMWQREIFLDTLGIDTMYYGKNRSRPPVSRDFVHRKYLPMLEEGQQYEYDSDTDDNDDYITFTVRLPIGDNKEYALHANRLWYTIQKNYKYYSYEEEKWRYIRDVYFGDESKTFRAW